MLLDDLPGENFPWRPKGIKDILKDVKLVNNKKEEKSFDDLAGKVIGFYFSAHWVSRDKTYLFTYCIYLNKCPGAVHVYKKNWVLIMGINSIENQSQKDDYSTQKWMHGSYNKYLQFWIKK